MRSLTALALAAGLLASLACIDPSDRRPGLRLSGPVVSDPVTDWSFTHDTREIYLETRTPYLVPHSVTILCADGGGKLFVGARSPVGKSWVRWVERDPEVRLKIAGKVYEARLTRLTEPAQIEEVRAAYSAKLGGAGNPLPPASAENELWYWRVDPRAG
jgi:hypothetical protein